MSKIVDVRIPIHPECRETCGDCPHADVTVEMGIFRDGERLISGEMVYVNANPESRKSLPLPEKLRKAIEVRKAGG